MPCALKGGGKMLSRICSPRGWQSVTTHRVRFYHVISRNRPFAATIHKRTPVYVGCYRQYSSRESAGGADVSNDAELFRPTPTYDIPSDSTIDVTQSADSITSQTENLTTAASSGLGGYTPSGLLQTALDLLHTHSHLPWWATIAATTVAIRLMLVPMAVQLHINAIKIANINPIAMEINKKMVEYRAKGNTIGMAMEGKKLTELYAKHDCSPFKSFLMPLVQMPIFMSFFFALRQMASLPLESMKTGGMFWFTDLTVPDPYFALPLIACASFISNIELGAEGGAPTDNEFSVRVKWFMRLSAIIILPVSVKFPAALFMYWVTNSLFSTAQIVLFRHPTVKKALGIPALNRVKTTPQK